MLWASALPSGFLGANAQLLEHADPVCISADAWLLTVLYTSLKTTTSVQRGMRLSRYNLGAMSVAIRALEPWEGNSIGIHPETPDFSSDAGRRPTLTGEEGSQANQPLFAS